jgi:hypothetical protein
LTPSGWRSVAVANAHFPYHPKLERAKSVRQQDEFFREICRSINDSSKWPDTAAFFLVGDLNYRVGRAWGESANSIFELPLEGQRRRDELAVEMERGLVPGLEEGVGNTGPLFPPTCKMEKQLFEITPRYYAGGEAVASITGQAANRRGYKFGKQDRRTASWCDRILYTGRAECLRYQDFDYGLAMRRSDHRAVVGLFRVSLGAA